MYVYVYEHASEPLQRSRNKYERNEKIQFVKEDGTRGVCNSRERKRERELPASVDFAEFPPFFLYDHIDFDVNG